MTPSTAIRLLFLAALPVLASAACRPVTGARILGRDLALADSRFSAFPASVTIGFAPEPGVQRTFTPEDLQRLARANGISLTAAESICFELPMTQLPEDDIVAAMRRSLPPDAALRIIDRPSFLVPAGVLEFPLDGLEPANPANPGVQLWRGRIRYAETRQIAFLAHVAISVSLTAVVAVRDLPANATIGTDSLRVETRTGPLSKEKAATRIEDVVGRIPRRTLKAGSLVPLAILAEAPAVRRGDPVIVEVQSGTAHIRFEAIAESAAREGEMLELRNPSSGRTFKARLDPGAKARLTVAAGQTL